MKYNCRAKNWSPVLKSNAHLSRRSISEEREGGGWGGSWSFSSPLSLPPSLNVVAPSKRFQAACSRVWPVVTFFSGIPPSWPACRADARLDVFTRRKAKRAQKQHNIVLRRPRGEKLCVLVWGEAVAQPGNKEVHRIAHHAPSVWLNSIWHYIFSQGLHVYEEAC